jgi:hypothetical protein
LPGTRQGFFAKFGGTNDRYSFPVAARAVQRGAVHRGGRFSGLDLFRAELVALAEAEADAGFPGQKESELAVFRALLRLILSPNVRMPLSRLQ